MRLYLTQLCLFGTIAVSVGIAVLGLTLQAAIAWRADVVKEHYKSGLERIYRETEPIKDEAEHAAALQTGIDVLGQDSIRIAEKLEETQGLRVILRCPSIAGLVALVILLMYIIILGVDSLDYHFSARRLQARQAGLQLHEMLYPFDALRAEQLARLKFTPFFTVAVMLLLSLVIVGAVEYSLWDVILSANNWHPVLPSVPIACAAGISLLGLAVTFVWRDSNIRKRLIGAEISFIDKDKRLATDRGALRAHVEAVFDAEQRAGRGARQRKKDLKSPYSWLPYVYCMFFAAALVSAATIAVLIR